MMGVETLGLFAVAAIAMIAVALAFVGPGLLRRSGHAPGPDAVVAHVEALREGARELDRELAAGEWSPADYAQARAELERTLVRDTPSTPQVPWRAPRALGWAIVIGLPVLAVTLYLALGEPEALRRERTDVPSTDANAATSVLAAYVRAHPGDARAWVLLARAEAEAERFSEAAVSYARAVEFPKVAQDAAVWCEYADVLGMTRGGSLLGRPEELIAEALKRDPTHPQALEMAGSAAYERRDFKTAARHWRTLLARLPPSAAERYQELAAAIARAERAGVTALPPAIAPSSALARTP